MTELAAYHCNGTDKTKLMGARLNIISIAKKLAELQAYHCNVTEQAKLSGAPLKILIIATPLAVL